MDLNERFSDKLGSIIENNKDAQNIINYNLPEYNEEINIDEYVDNIDLSILDNEFLKSLTNIYNYCKEISNVF